MRRGDDGVTLVELLVCLAIMGVVASALAMSFFASTRSIDQSSLRMANTHDSQMASTLFSSDMQSANWIWTDNPPWGFQSCGAGESLVTFAWIGSDSQGAEQTNVAAYRAIDQDGEHQLVRQACSGSGFGTTPASSVVIADNLYGAPTVDCFTAGNSTNPVSCEANGNPVTFIAAQLTAHAQASGADPTGFEYILRATRRPSASPSPSASTPRFVQNAANRAPNGSTSAAAFAQANTTGNLIVAYVVWSNGDVVNITDTNRNTYTPASASVPWGVVGPFGAPSSAQVFYATNVAGGTNTVTATFTTPVGGPSGFGLIYITEYSGVDKTNPLDVASPGAIGASSARMDSGTATTTNANDLLVGVGASSNEVIAAGTGYTFPPILPDDFGNIVEYRTVTASGAYSATATQSGNVWVMQLVAFRADASGPPPP